jgi:hypothetical protein
MGHLITANPTLEGHCQQEREDTRTSGGQPNQGASIAISLYEAKRSMEIAVELE